jgi:hypothetical protein
LILIPSLWMRLIFTPKANKPQTLRFPSHRSIPSKSTDGSSVSTSTPGSTGLTTKALTSTES